MRFRGRAGRREIRDGELGEFVEEWGDGNSGNFRMGTEMAETGRWEGVGSWEIELGKSRKRNTSDGEFAGKREMEIRERGADCGNRERGWGKSGKFVRCGGRNSQTEEGWWGEDWIRWKGRGGSGVRRNVREEEEGIPGVFGKMAGGCRRVSGRGFVGTLGRRWGDRWNAGKVGQREDGRRCGRKGRAEGEVRGGDDSGAAVRRRRRWRTEAAAAAA